MASFQSLSVTCQGERGGTKHLGSCDEHGEPRFFGEVMHLTTPATSGERATLADMAMATDLIDPIFTDENAARGHFERLRWPNGPICPHYGSIV
jgi:hypothetical protein